MKTGTSQGKAHPGFDLPNLDQFSIFSPSTCVDRDAVETSGVGRTHLDLAGWVQQRGKVSATVPMVSRRRWTQLVTAWTHSGDGVAMCAQFKVAAPTFVTIAAAVAKYCTGATGRNIAVTNATIAAQCGFSARLVSTVRRILASAGWAVEAVRGQGRSGGKFNRPSVWHLTMPRPTGDHRPPSSSTSQGVVVDKTRCDSADFHPLCSSSVERTSSVDQYSPSAPRARATSSTLKDSHRDRVPAPLSAHRLAAELAKRCQGLDSGHLGALVSALHTSHLDLDAWAGAELKNALDLAGQAARGGRGLTWPTRIRRPGAFLAWRLRDLPERPERVYVPPPAPVPAPRAALSAAGLAAKAAAFAVLKARRQRR